MSKNKKKQEALDPLRPADVPLVIPREIEEDKTINVKNDELLKMIDDYGKENTPENLNKLINRLVKSRILVPANINDKQQPVPLWLQNGEGTNFVPVYTDRNQLPKEAQSMMVVNMTYLAANHMAATPELGVSGIVLNPFTQNLIFRMPLVERIEEVEKNKKNAPQKKVMKLTQEQYVLFERHQFEWGRLPAHLYTKTEEFIQGICERKEEYLDELYEKGYQQQRMYPYLPEDFSIMIMDISEEMLTIRIDMPTRDIGPEGSYRVYITWNPKEKKADYFLIARAVETDQTLLVELTAAGKRIDHGEAPAEGAELQTILEYCAKTNQEN